MANGVNLDLLGSREPHIYGSETLEQILGRLREMGQALGVEIVGFQSNHEGAFLEVLSQRPAWDGIIINPGAWTHTNLALGDRLAALGIPYCEVHLSQLAQREDIRHRSYTAPGALGVIYGFGGLGYELALQALLYSIRGRCPQVPVGGISPDGGPGGSAPRNQTTS